MATYVAISPRDDPADDEFLRHFCASSKKLPLDIDLNSMMNSAAARLVPLMP